MTGHPLWPRGGVGNIQCPIHDPDDAVYEVHEEALPGESVGGTTGSTEPLVLVRTGWSGEQQQKQEQEQGKAKNSEHVTNPGTHVGQAQGHDRSIWVITSDSRDEDSVDLQKVSGMSSDDAQQGELSQ